MTPFHRFLSTCILAAALFSPLGLLSAQSRVATPLVDGWKLWLDRKAEWQSDPLFPVPGDISKLPVNPPTGGWGRLFARSLPESEAKKIVADSALSMDVPVPGTVEEFLWDELGNYVGVSWWGRDFEVPASAKGKRVKLFFSEGIRQRAEVFVNEKLVGYELVHQTPFEVDVTDAVRYGATNKLAVRITDPNGEFSWGDFHPLEWGDRIFPSAHGFGGILGTVVLNVVDPVHVSDVFVRNKPALRDVDAEIEIVNDGGQPMKGSAEVRIVEAWLHGVPVAKPNTVFSKPAGDFEVAPGKTARIALPASVPEAKLWGMRDGNLYNFVVTLKDAQGRVLDE